MTLKITVTSAQKTDAQVRDKAIMRALSDSGFRKKLISDPKAVLGEMRGKKIDSRVKVVVHEDTAELRNIVLPYTGVEIEEITAEELELISVRNQALQYAVSIG